MHNLSKDVKKEVNNNVEFLLTVVKGHFLAFACQKLKITKVTDKIPCTDSLKHGSHEEKRAFIYDLASSVVDELAIVEQAFDYKRIVEDDKTDYIYNYAHVLCHYGSLIMEFMDAWSEGDGERVYTCWKIFLPHFYCNSTKSKYAIEAVRLQLQRAILPPQLSYELIWGRFVNSKGGIGNNIPSDLHNEFVNKDIKDIIKNMGSNITEDALHCAARSITKIKAVCRNFDVQSHIHAESSSHTTKSFTKDINKIVTSILNNKILEKNPDGREHVKYGKISLNPLQDLEFDQLLKWINNKAKATAKKVKAKKERAIHI